MTIDTNEPIADEAEPRSTPDRKSVTVTLPSSRVVLRLLGGLMVLALMATVVVESIHIHNLDNSRTTSSLPPLQPSGSGLDATSRSAIAAATSYAEAFATYNYLHLAADFGATESHAVDPFLTEYQKETAQLRPSLIKAKASSTGTVKSAGIVSVTPTTAVVDVFLDQAVVNAGSSQPRVDSQRVQMSLTRVNNEWKISKVEVS
jgi:Mce-associated membrane protein